MVQEAKLSDSQHLSHWLVSLTVDLLLRVRPWHSCPGTLFSWVSVHRRGSTNSEEGRRRGERHSARSSLHILQVTLSFIGILKRMSGTRVVFSFFFLISASLPFHCKIFITSMMPAEAGSAQWHNWPFTRFLETFCHILWSKLWRSQHHFCSKAGSSLTLSKAQAFLADPSAKRGSLLVSRTYWEGSSHCFTSWNNLLVVNQDRHF